MEEEKKIQDAQVEEQIERQESTEEKVELTPEQKAENKMKNLLAAVILLTGLFLGSLFVDVAQMVSGGGFSPRALKNAEVLTAGGKTWVAYKEPIVKVQVVSDDTCQACAPEEVLLGLKQALPTMTNEKIDVNSAAGKKLVAEFNLKTLPAFIFSKEIEQTDLFAKAQPFLDKQGDSYAIKGAEAGFPVGKYIAAPEVSNQDITVGSSEAKLKVVAFSDFQNVADKKAFAEVLKPMLQDYTDKIQLVFKPYFPTTSTQSSVASLAAACANEQGKFLSFADKLFATQTTWSKVKDAAPIMKGFAAATGLNMADFGKCLDGKKYQDLVTNSLQAGQAFGLQDTPFIFVGNDLQDATVKYADLKNILDEQLAK